MNKLKTIGNLRPCSTCKNFLPLEKFSVLKNGGLHCSCKLCNSAIAKESYRRNRAEIAFKKRLDRKINPEKYANQYAANPELYKRLVRQHKDRYPQKVKVRKIAYNAILKGDLARQPCKYCNSSDRIEAHHTDYSKPLDVEWMCKLHHLAWHRVFQAEVY